MLSEFYETFKIKELKINIVYEHPEHKNKKQARQNILNNTTTEIAKYTGNFLKLAEKNFAEPEAVFPFEIDIKEIKLNVHEVCGELRFDYWMFPLYAYT